MSKRLLRYFLCWAVLVAYFPTSLAVASSDRKDYQIGAGDVLHISVWKDTNLTRQVVVLPDGTLSFPLIGSIPAEGMTVEALTQDIKQRLVKYVPDPVLSVEVMQVNSLMIYVIGKVNRPGRFVLANNINVMQALALAGGLNAFAKSDKIKIFRKSGETTRTIAFGYDDVSKGKQLEQNIILERGDVIVVP